METQNGKDWLEDILTHPSPHIAENGFTERVLENLPARRMSGRARALVLTVAVALGGILGLFVLPGGTALAATLTKVFTPSTWMAPAAHLDSITLAAVVLAGLIWGSISLALAER
jgi:hypothetical protein